MPGTQQCGVRVKSFICYPYLIRVAIMRCESVSGSHRANEIKSHLQGFNFAEAESFNFGFQFCLYSKCDFFSYSRDNTLFPPCTDLLIAESFIRGAAETETFAESSPLNNKIAT